MNNNEVKKIELRLNVIEKNINDLYEEIRTAFSNMKRANGYNLSYVLDVYKNEMKNIDAYMTYLENEEIKLRAICDVIEYKSQDYNRALELLEKIREVRAEKVTF